MPDYQAPENGSALDLRGRSRLSSFSDQLDDLAIAVASTDAEYGRLTQPIRDHKRIATTRRFPIYSRKSMRRKRLLRHRMLRADNDRINNVKFTSTVRRTGSLESKVGARPSSATDCRTEVPRVKARDLHRKFPHSRQIAESDLWSERGTPRWGECAGRRTGNPLSPNPSTNLVGVEREACLVLWERHYLPFYSLARRSRRPTQRPPRTLRPAPRKSRAQVNPSRFRRGRASN